MEQPMAKLASSPTPAVTVPLMMKFKRIFMASMMMPAAGPIAKQPMRMGTSLKSIL